MPTARKPEAVETPLREVLHPERLVSVPDANDPVFRARLKAAIAAMDPEEEADVMRWIEAVSMFHNEDRDLE
ncbi:hypothetical protein [Rhizobium sp. CFBP 8752]|uniref:hypothetical protein n=1 Tax=Rhizobium/Agrobacterium group TaxID=227290 RepID=UPI00178010DB|nr:hypothetical protein [Rhizobium sp. CFBP 8752]MBD8662106.1 hypothetical protein [Rhizobium sp. CFBP 8752]